MRVMALANLYRPDHLDRLQPYRRLNPAASSWNTAMFRELAHMDLDLQVVQFLPIRRKLVIQEQGITFHYLPRIPGIDSFTSVAKRARVASLVRELKPNVVHGIGSEHGYAWPATGHGVPSMITIHGYLKEINRIAGHKSLLKKMFLVREEQRALRAADCVIAINEYMRDCFIEDGAQADRMVVVLNALNPVFLEAFEEPAVRDIDILMVGSLYPRKNQHVALELFSRLAKDHHVSPRVVIAGAATAQSIEYEAQLRALQSDLGLHNVTFAGSKTPAELAALYRRSRFLLHISEWEADPTVVPEAWGCGTLPVVNPVYGLGFRVQDGRNGFHLPIADRAAASKRLAEILLQDDARRDLVRAAQLSVMDRRPRSVAEVMAAIYRRVGGQVNAALT